MTDYFLHTGMHKTGTKFFQHKVFPNLDKVEVSYNPPKLCQLIADLLKAEPCDVDLVLDAIVKEKMRLEAGITQKVLISREIMSGDLFSFYKGYKENYTRLNRAFPEAKIIMAMRYQVDWIVSCYRETLHEHHYQTIGQFLGFEPGDDRFVKADYRDLDYSSILTQIKTLFGVENMSVFFYEDFRKDKLEMLSHISDILGVDNIPVTDDGDTIPNRGYSALAAVVSIKRYRCLKALGLDHYFVHRPIRFFGDGSIPAGFEDLSVLPKEKYWHDEFLRDNEEIRSDGYPNNLSLLERWKHKVSWRNLMKENLDKITYKDWDLLGKYRPKLNAYFKGNNNKLLELHCDVLKKAPINYTSESKG